MQCTSKALGQASPTQTTTVQHSETVWGIVVSISSSQLTLKVSANSSLRAKNETFLIDLSTHHSDAKSGDTVIITYVVAKSRKFARDIEHVGAGSLERSPRPTSTERGGVGGVARSKTVQPSNPRVSTAASAAPSTASTATTAPYIAPNVTAGAAIPPLVLYRPQPVYPAVAKAAGLQGDVSLKIRVLPTGKVQVLGVTRSLGHGFDESAMQAINDTRFRPAFSSTGQPTAWEGTGYGRRCQW